MRNYADETAAVAEWDARKAEAEDTAWEKRSRER
jgi:hypothetical protein